MLPLQRNAFNQQFSAEKYQQYLQLLAEDFPGAIDFRVAETPVFIGRGFKKKMLDTCKYIIKTIQNPDYLAQTEKAIPKELRVPGAEGRPHFLIFDFGVCMDQAGKYTPMLIEMQGFPTLFAYQLHQYQAAQKAYDLPEAFSPFLNGFDHESVLKLLNSILKGDNDPAIDGAKTDQQAVPQHTVLLEIFPEKQKTRIDFLYTEKYLGVPIVCLTELIEERQNLYYERGGKRIKIDRIYNRLIFDELTRQTKEVQDKAKILFEPLNVIWITHPNWFYRLSKYTLPLLDHPQIPKARLLSDYPEIPEDLENYVLKPLFSFAGNGVIIDLKKADIEAIAVQAQENYILQQKVAYAPAILTEDVPAKAEIRLFYLWEDGAPEPVAICNLARLTKGNMVSVAQNKNKTWVGGSYGLFEPEA